MALTENTFPFDAVTGSPSYGALFMRHVLNALNSSGFVLGVGNGLRVIASTPNAMTVEIRTGSAWLGSDSTGHALYNIPDGSDNKILSVPSNSTGSTREDYVELELDLTASPNAITAKYVTGTTSPPSVTRSSTIWQLVLAQISVPNGAVSVSDAIITDKRTDPTLCGISINRGVDPADLPDWDLSTYAGSIATVRQILGANATVTPPSGYQWEVLGVDNNTGTAFSLGNASSPTIVYYSSLATNVYTPFARPFLISNGQNIYLQTNLVLHVIQSAAVAGKTPVFFRLNTTGSVTYTVTSGKRLKILRCASAYSAAQQRIVDNASGVAYIYTAAPVGYTGSASSYQWGAGGVVTQLDPQSPVCYVPSGRVIATTLAQDLYVMGVEETSAWAYST